MLAAVMMLALVAAPVEKPDQVLARLNRAKAAYDARDCTTALRELARYVVPGAGEALPRPYGGIALLIAADCQYRTNALDRAYSLILRATAFDDLGTFDPYAWQLRLVLDRRLRHRAEMVATVEQMAAGHGAVLNTIDITVFYQLSQILLEEKTPNLRRRLLKALTESYDPAPVTGNADYLRLDYARMLLADGAPAAASASIVGVTNPAVLRDVMADRDLRFALPAGFDLYAATERWLERNRQLAKENPKLLAPILDMVTSMRELGQTPAALALLESTRSKLDDGSFADIGERRSWWWDALAATYRALDRVDDAGAAYRKGMMLNENGGANISQVVNAMSMYAARDRPKDALALLDEVGAVPEGSGYGDAALLAATACARHQLGQVAEVDAARASLVAAETAAPHAYAGLLLCIGEPAPAAAEVIRLLADPALRSRPLQWFGDWRESRPGQPKSRSDRTIDVLKQRADVQAALRKAGGIVSYNVYDD